MSIKTYPDAKLLPTGELVSIEDETPLPGYTGLVYADFGGRSYIMWAFPPDDDGQRNWAVINPGSVVVQTALDKFMKEHSIE